jgi:hypothetical protein
MFTAVVLKFVKNCFEEPANHIWSLIVNQCRNCRGSTLLALFTTNNKAKKVAGCHPSLNVDANFVRYHMLAIKISQLLVKQCVNRGKLC